MHFFIANRRLISIFLSLIFLASCSVKYVADYDSSIKEETVNVAKQVDLFWGNLLDTPVSNRQYAQFKDQYNLIETEIRGLLIKNQIRALNELSTKQIEILLGLWIEDKESHKTEDTFSDFLANRHRQQFVRLFVAIAKGEEAKKMATGSSN